MTEPKNNRQSKIELWIAFTTSLNNAISAVDEIKSFESQISEILVADRYIKENILISKIHKDLNLFISNALNLDSQENPLIDEKYVQSVQDEIIEVLQKTEILKFQDIPDHLFLSLFQNIISIEKDVSVLETNFTIDQTMLNGKLDNQRQLLLNKFTKKLNNIEGFLFNNKIDDIKSILSFTLVSSSKNISKENDSQEKKPVATDNFRKNIFQDSLKENNSVNTEENNLKETLNSILSNVPIISNSGKEIDSDAPKQEDEDINEKLDNENLKTESVSQKNPLDDDPLFN